MEEFSNASTSANHAQAIPYLRFPSGERGSSGPSSPEQNDERSFLVLGPGPSSLAQPYIREQRTRSEAAPRKKTRRRVRSVNVEDRRDVEGMELNRGSLDGSPVTSDTPTTRRFTKPDEAMGGADPVHNDLTMQGFADEFDLAQDDPKVVQDVQRALKLKARRESRMKGRSHSPLLDLAIKNDQASSSSRSANSSTRVTFPANAAPSGPRFLSPERHDVDFSPSVGVVALHPCPCTLDDGATLDWTGAYSDGETSSRRWTLSLTKQKGKDKLPPTPVTVEKQVARYEDKLARIRKEASQHTLRKAELIKDQLERRYDLLYKPPGPSEEPFNILRVAKWHADQETIVKSSLDSTEPFAWLKHLLDRRKVPSWQVPWQISAFIAEEYLRVHGQADVMETIPEVPGAEGLSPPQASPPPPSLTAPSTPSRPRIATNYSFGRAASIRRSIDGMVTFEPTVESRRSSFDEGSGPSMDGHNKSPRNSLQGNPTSAHNSIYRFGASANHLGSTSPASSRLHIRDIASRLGARRRPAHDSDGGTSGRESLSEDHNRSDDGAASQHVLKNGTSRPGSLSLQPPQDRPSDRDNPLPTVDTSENKAVKRETLEVPNTARARSKSIDSEAQPTARPRAGSEQPSVESGGRSRVIHRHRARISLPNADQIVLDDDRQREQEEEHERERHEYEMKSHVLDDLMSQNQRIRHLLQRAAHGVRDYDALQSRLMASLGLPSRSIPQELLDAFSHDPSAVTGSTRRQRGWRAVEDIHKRIARQRETFRIFLSVAKQDGIFPPPGSVLEDPIADLLQSLDRLEQERAEIAKHAQSVVETLARVKNVHADVKADYNETLSHTSIAYPELSQIVALEESYKDHYQQIWELGMDALTFLLDKITPVWRVYGKAIGQDVSDFLVIPLYRNEFTGEAKRYPITKVPRRSFRRWMTYLLFTLLMLIVLVLQLRFAVWSTFAWRMTAITHSGLWWVSLPAFLTVVLIQWCAVVIELGIISAEVAIVMWWFGWSLGVFT